MIEKVLTIFFVVPPEITSLAKKLKKKFGLNYSNVSTIHVTLHLTKIPEENFFVIIKKLNDLNLQKFNVEMLDTNLGVKNFLSISLKKNKKLFNCHKKIIDVVNRYRNGLIRLKDMKRMKEKKFTQNEQKLLKTYGYTRVLENFHPHITLGYPQEKPNIVPDTFKKMQIETGNIINKKFSVENIIIRLNNYDNDKDKYTTIKQKKVTLR